MTDLAVRHVERLADLYDVSGGEPIGIGSFSSVFKARALATGRACAVKVVRRQRGDEVEAEARVLAAVRHPACLRLVECLADRTCAYIVTDLVPGEELHRFIAQHGALPEATVQRIAAELVGALQYLHLECGIVHGDLKPENIMISMDEAGGVAPPPRGQHQRRPPRAAPLHLIPKVTIIDFGAAMSGVAAASPAPMKVRVSGTLLYSAPELLDHITVAGSYPMTARAADVHLLDVFSLGTCVALCLTGRLPFAPPDYPKDEPALLPRVECLLDFVEAEYPRLLSADTRVSPAAAAWVRRCLHPDPRQRLRTPDMTLTSGWLSIAGSVSAAATAARSPPHAALPPTRCDASDATHDLTSSEGAAERTPPAACRHRAASDDDPAWDPRPATKRLRTPPMRCCETPETPCPGPAPYELSSPFDPESQDRSSS